MAHSSDYLNLECRGFKQRFRPPNAAPSLGLILAAQSGRWQGAFTLGQVAELSRGVPYAQILRPPNPTLQLTRFIDFGLRVLMYLCTPAPDQREQAVTVAEIAERFEVSRHHLNKVVQFLAQQGWVVTSRGKGRWLRDGMRLVGLVAYRTVTVEPARGLPCLHRLTTKMLVLV